MLQIVFGIENCDSKPKVDPDAKEKLIQWLMTAIKAKQTRKCALKTENKCSETKLALLDFRKVTNGASGHYNLKEIARMLDGTNYLAEAHLSWPLYKLANVSRAKQHVQGVL